MKTQIDDKMSGDYIHGTMYGDSYIGYNLWRLL